MIDFLMPYVKIDTIDNIYKINNESSIYDLSVNKENCLKIINYFIEIGITNLDDLLIYEIDIFKNTFNDLIRKFKNFNIPLFVKIINDDYTAIEDIYEVN